LLDAESDFCHYFFDDRGGIRVLCTRVYALFSDECGNFFAEGVEVVISLLLADLELAFLEDLIKGIL
jgi:hypothetical protein